MVNLFIPKNSYFHLCHRQGQRWKIGQWHGKTVWHMAKYSLCRTSCWQSQVMLNAHLFMIYIKQKQGYTNRSGNYNWLILSDAPDAYENHVGKDENEFFLRQWLFNCLRNLALVCWYNFHLDQYQKIIN